MRSIFLALALTLTLGLVFAAGCHHHAMMSVPAGFGRVDGGYDFRAASPSGIVVAARVEPNRPRSDLGFWASAIDLQLVRKGYARTASTEVRSASGVPGKLLKYDTGAGTGYWVAVFARGDALLVAEATGPMEDLDAATPDVETALLSARLD